MTQEQSPVALSENAAKRVKYLINQENNPNLKLRLTVSGGGCSGFQYGFSFSEDVDASDLIVKRDGVTLVVDEMSLIYIIGAEVDYVEDLVGSSFQIKNPNAQSSCGCGSSFSI